MENATASSKSAAVGFNNYLAGVFSWMFAGLSVSGIVEIGRAHV